MFSKSTSILMRLGLTHTEVLQKRWIIFTYRKKNKKVKKKYIKIDEDIAVNLDK